MIDTHCHLTYAGLYERVADVLAAAGSAGAGAVITVGTSPDDAGKAVALAQQFTGADGLPEVFATVGLHPHYAGKSPDQAAVERSTRELAARPRVVALGEMGLDYHYPDPPRGVQRRAFEWQLEVMKGLGRLPAVIHNREATADTLAVLRASGLAPQRFVFHCFTGSAEELREVFDSGAMVGFTGIVTFKNARALAAAAAAVPIDRLLIETDSPYLTPEPYRKVKVNEPRYAAEVAAFLAQGRGMAVADFVAATDANARRFFGLP